MKNAASRLEIAPQFPGGKRQFSGISVECVVARNGSPITAASSSPLSKSATVQGSRIPSRTERLQPCAAAGVSSALAAAGNSSGQQRQGSNNGGGSRVHCGKRNTKGLVTGLATRTSTMATTPRQKTQKNQTNASARFSPTPLLTFSGAHPIEYVVGRR